MSTFYKSDASYDDIDPETRELFRARPIASTYGEAYAYTKRARGRNNNFPAISEASIEEAHNAITSHKKLWMYGVGATGFFTFACYQFGKVYFPHGLIIRHSLPVSWGRYVMTRGPAALLAVFTWYLVREYPRGECPDLSSKNERN